MKTFVITGGTSGVGLQTARELIKKGQQVIIIGRNPQKGAAAVQKLGTQAQFIAGDLATFAGTRTAAKKIAQAAPVIDGLLHSAAVFEPRDVRTEDGVPLLASLNYLTRFELTELLMPQLLAAKQASVLMMTGAMKELPDFDPERFQSFPDYSFRNYGHQLGTACAYYADYLMSQHPTIFAGCITPGFVKTDLYKNSQFYIRAFVNIASPFIANSLEDAAAIPARALQERYGNVARVWNKVAHYDKGFDVKVDSKVRDRLIEISRRHVETEK